MTPTEQELFEERAAIMEFDGGMSREEAEREAKELINRRNTETQRGNDRKTSV